MLRRTSRLGQMGGPRLHHHIGTSLHKDRADRMSHVRTLIKSKLTGRDVQEAFNHLNCNTGKAVLPYDGAPDLTYMHGGLRLATPSRLMSHHSKLATTFRPTESYVELLVSWPTAEQRRQGMAPRCATGVGAGDNWRLLVRLVQAAWIHGTIPRQLLWSIVVLILKGSPFGSVLNVTPSWCVELLGITARPFRPAVVSPWVALCPPSSSTLSLTW
jgi:hypothetical protein